MGLFRSIARFMRGDSRRHALRAEVMNEIVDALNTVATMHGKHGVKVTPSKGSVVVELEDWVQEQLVMKPDDKGEEGIVGDEDDKDSQKAGTLKYRGEFINGRTYYKNDIVKRSVGGFGLPIALSADVSGSTGEASSVHGPALFISIEDDVQVTPKVVEKNGGVVADPDGPWRLFTPIGFSAITLRVNPTSDQYAEIDPNAVPAFQLVESGGNNKVTARLDAPEFRATTLANEGFVSATILQAGDKSTPDIQLDAATAAGAGAVIRLRSITFKNGSDVNETRMIPCSEPL